MDVKLLLGAGSSLLGIVVGVTLISFVAAPFFRMLDRTWVKAEHLTSATVLAHQVLPGKKKTYRVRFRLPQSHGFAAGTMLVENQDVYDWVERNLRPPRALRVEVERGRFWLTATPTLVRVNGIRIPRKVKNSRLVLLFLLNVMGGAVIFAALRDFRKRWLQWRHRRWVSEMGKDRTLVDERGEILENEEEGGRS